MSASMTKPEIHFHEAVQGIVIGDNNTVTIQFVNGQQQTVPFLAPPRPPYRLIGRDQLLADLKRKLVVGQSLALSALNGLPGVGKTALAIELAYDKEVIAHFPDGVLWAGLGPKADVLALLGNWALALGFHANEIASRKTVKERQNLLKAVIGQKRMLLVIDDAWESETALAFRVGGLNCAHLLTTRQPLIALDFAGNDITTVQELSGKDGLLLLSKLAPAAVSAEPEAATELVGAVGNLPLALILIGCYLRDEAHTKQPRRISQALKKLQKTEARLTLKVKKLPGHHPGLSDETPLSLVAAIAISEEALDESTRHALYALSVFPAKPNTFSEEAAVAVTAQPVETLDTLTDSGLLEASGPTRYTLHQTIADYVSWKHSDEQAYERFASFFVTFVETNAREFNLLELELNNVLATLDIARAHDMSTAFVRGLEAFYRFVDIRGLYETTERYLQQAEQIAREANSTESLIRVLLKLGRTTRNRGNLTQAEEYYQEGLVLAKETDYREGIAGAHIGLGAIALDQGHPKQAKAQYQKGLAFAQKIGHHEEIIWSLSGLGAVESGLGNIKQAKRYWQKGLALAQKFHNRERMTAMLVNLGSVAINQGEFKQAGKYSAKGLVLAREMGHRERISHLLETLGVSVANQGKHEEAEVHWQEGLAVAREIGHRDRVSNLLLNLGALAGNRGKYEQAKAYLLEGLTLAREMHNPGRISFLLLNMGMLATTRGAYEEAATYLQEGLQSAQALNDQKLISIGQKAWGELYYKQQQWVQAIEAFQITLKIAQRLGLPKSIGDALFGLAQVSRDQGNIDEAQRLGQESLAAFEAISHEMAAEVKAWLAKLNDESEQARTA
jgi:tetratricopeptide (TPR) repeat protein